MWLERWAGARLRRHLAAILRGLDLSNGELCKGVILSDFQKILWQPENAVCDHIRSHCFLNTAYKKRTDPDPEDQSHTDQHTLRACP